MAMMKVISLVDHEIALARTAAVHDLEQVQTQIIAKINEIMAVCNQLRHDVDGLLERPNVLN